MSEPTSSPRRYRIIPSAHVVAEAKSLVGRAARAGHGAEALAALKEMNHRLSVYPQFGEILMDLQQTGESLWVATIPPLAVQYVIDESIHAVFIGMPFKALPNAGFE